MSDHDTPVWPVSSNGHPEAEPSGAPEGWTGDWYPHWRQRPPRDNRTRDWRDCAHCRHYTSGGSAGGTPPWPVCQFWPRREPATCDSYAYVFKPWLRADGRPRALHPKDPE